MESQEQKKETALAIDKDSKIEVVVNSPGWEDDSIDLGRVFRNFKKNKRVYAWVLVLCVVIGLCAPLLMYQFTRDPLTVSSVVTLQYNVQYTEETDVANAAGNSSATGSAARSAGKNGEQGTVPVSDLTAPDGKPLDLNQITSSYVLQNAVSGMTLSKPVSLKNLRDNIRITRILTEDSRRQQEVASSMVDQKTSGAYSEVQNIELKYENKFVVSLTNGFGEEDSRVKNYLKDAELRTILDRILSAYNEYLFRTYTQIQLPAEEFSAIDTENLDLLESLDLIRTAVDNLYDYCDKMPESVKTYRSWKTGSTLNDWMEILQTARDVNVDYLYSYAYTNSIVRDKASMITNYQYQLRNAETRLDVLNNDIATVKSILDNYKNDEIFVSMQESDTSKSTRTTTDYYNELILQQADYYADAAELETTIADLQDKIASLTAQADAGVEEEDRLAQAEEELKTAVTLVENIYQNINAHMEEMLESPLAKNYISASAAYGKTRNFLVASAKGMAIGAAAGAVVAIGLWFLSALAPEFIGEEDTKRRNNGKEAANA